MHDYYYYEYKDGETYIVDFTPQNASKGLVAIKIFLTCRIFNDKTHNEKFKALVIDFSYDVQSLSTIVQGIKQGDKIPFGATLEEMEIIE